MDEININIIANKYPIKPYLRRNMTRSKLHGKHGICAVIQNMYLETEDEEIQLLLRIAMRYSKMLDSELRTAKFEYEHH